MCSLFFIYSFIFYNFDLFFKISGTEERITDTIETRGMVDILAHFTISPTLTQIHTHIYTNTQTRKHVDINNTHVKTSTANQTTHTHTEAALLFPCYEFFAEGRLLQRSAAAATACSPGCLNGNCKCCAPQCKTMSSWFQKGGFCVTSAAFCVGTLTQECQGLGCMCQGRVCRARVEEGRKERE